MLLAHLAGSDFTKDVVGAWTELHADLAATLKDGGRRYFLPGRRFHGSGPRIGRCGPGGDGGVGAGADRGRVEPSAAGAGLAVGAAVRRGGDRPGLGRPFGSGYADRRRPCGAGGGGNAKARQNRAGRASTKQPSSRRRGGMPVCSAVRARLRSAAWGINGCGTWRGRIPILCRKARNSPKRPGRGNARKGRGQGNSINLFRQSSICRRWRLRRDRPEHGTLSRVRMSLQEA